MTTQPARLTIKRLATGAWALLAGRELIDIYPTQETAQAARDYAAWVSWSLRHPNYR